MNKAAVASFSLDGHEYKVSNGDSGDDNSLLAGAGAFRFCDFVLSFAGKEALQPG